MDRHRWRSRNRSPRRRVAGRGRRSPFRLNERRVRARRRAVRQLWRSAEGHHRGHVAGRRAQRHRHQPDRRVPAHAGGGRTFRTQTAATRPARCSGVTVAMSSMTELTPWAGHVNYAAAKGGVRMIGYLARPECFAAPIPHVLLLPVVPAVSRCCRYNLGTPQKDQTVRG